MVENFGDVSDKMICYPQGFIIRAFVSKGTGSCSSSLQSNADYLTGI
jgi:hypothetical protein